MTKLFLCWFRLALPNRAVCTLFKVSEGTVHNVLLLIIDSLRKHYVPYHLGFGPLHQYEGEPFTRELVNGKLSTWISQEIGKKVFQKNVSGVADGTYIYLTNFGGFQGNKKLYSGQKKRPLSKVRFWCRSSRNYKLYKRQSVTNVTH